MNVEQQIQEYIDSLPEPKNSEVQQLHQLSLKVLPGVKLWFFDGKNSDGRVVSNPTIGYGSYTIHYANGKNREMFQTGLSANKSGISVYILGIKDKTYLGVKYGKVLGKASVTGYCIKFKALKDINLEVLEDAIRDGMYRRDAKT